MHLLLDPGELREAIREIVRSFHPDFIVIEPSGAADIQGIQEEISRIPEVRPERYVLIVNAKKVRVMLKAVRSFFYDQIRCSDMIYLNRADQITEAALQQVKKRYVKKTTEYILSINRQNRSVWLISRCRNNRKQIHIRRMI